MHDRRVPELIVVGATLTAGLVGAVFALGSRGADAQFLQDQRHPPDLRAPDVERVVRTAPDPREGKGTGESASCVRRGTTPLGNPWRCVVTYKSGRKATLSVRVAQDGTYSARYIAVGGGGATGCCIDLPGTR
jgi:hypothetical protein